MIILKLSNITHYDILCRIMVGLEITKSRETFRFARHAMAGIGWVVLICASRTVAADFVGNVLYPLTPQINMPNQSTGIAQMAVAGQVVGYEKGPGLYQHALIWTSAPSSPVDLQPTDLSGFSASQANGAYGSQQVGQGVFSSANYNHALLWTGTAGSAVDLNPTNLPGFITSYANATDGSQQVGEGYGGGTALQALLWTSTANSAVDLNPTGFEGSEAAGVGGGQQVGWGIGTDHALLWTGTANSAVDLNPTGFNISLAVATNGSQQVGNGSGPTTGYQTHALMWSGSASSAVDLNPTNTLGITSSFAEGTNGYNQVGYGNMGSGPSGAYFALLWSGTAASAVDLQLLLPATDTWTASNASSIDANGDVYGWAYGTVNGVTGEFAVEWSPVPEPSSLSLIAISFAGLLHRRRP
jgi:hypothetical protein